ncbi:MAG: hypothetical protein JSV88_01085 [Candidatus Aminicenantes bacterium]|nr:MAG: hypothetical protein JSV88_01085 [Candidatus Aminicenantes bacterium]
MKVIEDANKDKWKIRFGQIFQALLAKSGKELEDYFYFLPSGAQPDVKTDKSFELIDLNVNRSLYNRYFSSQVLVVPKLSKETAARLDSTLVIVPGFGHHTIETRAFAEQMDLLKELGFEVVYAFYDDSFESIENCAKRVYDIVKSRVDEGQKMIFLTYSKGSSILVELLSHPRYEDVTAGTRAVVSFAGALRGSIHADLPAARISLKLLKLYQRLSKGGSFATRIRRKLLKWFSKLPCKSLKLWHALVEKAFEFEDDLRDLPEGITDLTRKQAAKDYSRVQLPGSIKLFSISAVYPESEFQKGVQFITNADDLFLYIIGSPLYRYNVFNDTQVLLPDSEFFPGTGDITNLGIVKADHWGITLPNVLSRHYTDPFPRTEMLSAVLLILDEYFNPSS